MSDLQWAIVDEEKGDPTPKSLKKNREYYFSNGSSSNTIATTTPRAIPKGKSPAERGARYSSAPVEVPDRKTYRCKKGNSQNYQNDDMNEDEDEDEDDGEMIPPHDYIARRLAKKNISSFSMCEGNGRTLKGRDLRRVRNDVLSKTGFLE